MRHDELANSVVHVDHQVAWLQIAQVGQEGLREGTPAFGLAPVFFKDVALGKDLEFRRG